MGNNVLLAYTSRYIRPTTEEIYSSDYECLRQIFNSLGIEHTMYYEVDKHRGNGLHVHGTLSVPKSVFRKRMLADIKDKGFYFHIKPVTDIRGWHNYCIKQQK